MKNQKVKFELTAERTKNKTLTNLELTGEGISFHSVFVVAMTAMMKGQIHSANPENKISDRALDGIFIVEDLLRVIENTAGTEIFHRAIKAIDMEENNMHLEEKKSVH